jgi:DNA-binding phage protein
MSTTPTLTTTVGRPSSYSPELAETICDRIAEGESLRAICASEGMPGTTTVKRWLRNNEEFRAQYVRAREEQAEHYLDEIMEIADDGSNDYMTIVKGDVTYNVENKEVTSRSKMRIDTRKWAMSKLAPKKYGDKLDITSGGEKLPPQYYILPDGSRIEF